MILVNFMLLKKNEKFEKQYLCKSVKHFVVINTRENNEKASIDSH